VTTPARRGGRRSAPRCRRYRNERTSGVCGTGSDAPPRGGDRLPRPDRRPVMARCVPLRLMR